MPRSHHAHTEKPVALSLRIPQSLKDRIDAEALRKTTSINAIGVEWLLVGAEKKLEA